MKLTYDQLFCCQSMRCAACILNESSGACLLPNALTNPPLFLKPTLCVSALIAEHCHKFYIKCC